MADRYAQNYDPTVPTGAGSPRRGDDELRDIKTRIQQSSDDLIKAPGTATAGGTTSTNNTWHSDITASGDANIGGDVTVTGQHTSTGGYTGDLTGNVNGTTATLTGTTTANNFATSNAGESVGIYRIEPATNGDPVAADFAASTNLILQY